MKKTQTPRWHSRLNRGLIAIAAIALLCVMFVVAAGIYVKTMPKKMIKQAGVAFVGDEVAAEAEWMCLVGTAN